MIWRGIHPIPRTIVGLTMIAWAAVAMYRGAYLTALGAGAVAALCALDWYVAKRKLDA